VTDTPMMKCGHSSNFIGTYPLADGGRSESSPACAICSCFEVDESPPSLEGRLARCFYYGRPVNEGLRDKGGCDTRASSRGSDDDRRCVCEKQSSSELWFFERKDNADYDTFYCGCWGYD
jgi:hypothetical protein